MDRQTDQQANWWFLYYAIFNLFEVGGGGGEGSACGRDYNYLSQLAEMCSWASQTVL